jgi:hypothetical protein
MGEFPLEAKGGLGRRITIGGVPGRPGFKIVVYELYLNEWSICCNPHG